MTYLFSLKSAERGLKYGNNTQQFLYCSSSLVSDCDALATWFKFKELPRQFQRAFGINTEIVGEGKQT
jgi:hypothetical protein